MTKRFFLIILCLFLLAPNFLLAQEENPGESNEENQQPLLFLDIGQSRQVPVNRTISFDTSNSIVPENAIVEEIVWNFGDGTRTTGPKVTHAYKRSGTFTVRADMKTSEGSTSNTTIVDVFANSIVIIADNTISDEQIALARQQAQEKNTLAIIIRPTSGGPEVITEDELSQQLLDRREDINDAHLVLTWTSGSVGANALSKFAQHVQKTTETAASNLDLRIKSIVLITSTPFSVLSPTAQTVFDQLQPAYVAISRPEAVPLLIDSDASAEDVREALFTSPLEYRLFGTFSARSNTDIGITNFMSAGINFLINRGVPVSSITLILMLPIIATILAFARQIIGIKAFGIITPAMTTLTFLVLGLQYGLVVFGVMLLSGTITRLILRRFHLLYLPRMALVLTTASLGLLGLLAIAVTLNRQLVSSFSIFPALILIILAEEFISVQFKAGAKSAMTITAWTLALSIAGYYIVSWELLRTLLISFPEIVLLTLPINLILGRWAGLRLTELIRFRELLRNGSR